MLRQESGDSGVKKSQDYYKLKAILDAAVDAIIMIGSDGVIQAFNHTAEKMFGYTESEVIGQNIKILMPSPYREEHDQHLENYIKTRQTNIIGVGREVTAMRRDGSTFPMHLAVSVVENPVSEDELLFTGFIHDLTAEKEKEEKILQQTEELEHAYKKSKSANHSMDEFLANMSHEIRTPLAAIVGFSETLLTEGDIEKAPRERIEAIQTIMRNGEHLLELINDILDLSKIQNGKLEIENIEFDLFPYLYDVMTLLRVKADAKGLQLNLKVNGKLPKVIQSDPTRLRQILVNLLGNAIKFTEVGIVSLEVTGIKSELGESLLKFDVIDSGIGMSEEQLGRIFNAFSQADTTVTRKFGGTGLGLSISLRLANLLGGTITVTSEPEKGSVFSAIVTDDPVEDIELIDQATYLSEVNTKKIMTESSKAKSSKVKLDSRILLVEDGPDNQRLISFLLKKAGAKVTVKENGQLGFDEAMDAKEAGKPYDVVLMDMQMPVLDGYSATAKLRACGYDRPIIALTAHAMASDRQKCLDKGCTDYTTKPVKKDELLEMVAKYTKQPTAVIVE